MKEKTRTLIFPQNPKWKLVLDRSEIYPDDPGNGTPAMVYGPNGISGTYGCAMDTGECDGVEIPSAVFRWLERQEEAVDAMYEAGAAR